MLVEMKNGTDWLSHPVKVTWHRGSWASQIIGCCLHRVQINFLQDYRNSISEIKIMGKLKEI